MIYNKDCRIAMRDISANFISLIITDPPYFLDRMDDDWDNDFLRDGTRSEVVKGFPQGMKFDSQQGARLYHFLKPIADEWLRIIRPGGFVLCFSQPRLVHRAASAIDDAGFEIRDLLAWKCNGQTKAFTQDHFVRKRNIPEAEKQRIISALNNRRTPQLRPQMESIILAQAPRVGTFVDNWMEHQTGLINADAVIQPHKFPGTIIDTPRVTQKIHPTEKPIILIQHLIRIFGAGDNGIVLDPFAGSGSTEIAARLEGYSFIGYEIDNEMATIANKRVNEYFETVE